VAPVLEFETENIPDFEYLLHLKLFTYQHSWSPVYTLR